MDVIRIAGIVEESIVDGPGIRFVIFGQGCPHYCEGCHNQHTHDFSGGYDMKIEEIVIKVRKNPLIDGVTYSGGEPFIQAEPFLNLSKRLKNFNYNILIYTGYTFEELLHMSKNDTNIKELMDYTDIIIDGLFDKNMMDYTLKFKGSANQRTINVPKSVKEGRVVTFSF